MGEDKFKNRFEKLIGQGKEKLDKSGWDGKDYKGGGPSLTEYSNFFYSCLDLIKDYFGDGSAFYIGLEKIMNDPKKIANPYYYAFCYGILEGAYNKYKEDIK